MPGAAAAIDLDGPLGDMNFGRAPSGTPYGSLLALVRLHGDPIATLQLPLHDGYVSGAELADRIWAKARFELEAHICAHDCQPDSALSREALSNGLPSGECPRRALDQRDPPFVTVVVPTAGRPNRVRNCIQSLGAMAYPSFEILIVDNAPDDRRTREVVDACAVVDSRIRYVAEPLRGSSLARNRGIPASSSEILAFTDDDIEVDRQWLTWMVEPFVADDRVGVVTGLVMPLRLDTPQQRWFEEFSGFGKGLEPRRYDTGPYRAPDQPLFPYWGAAFGSGGSMAFRRAVLLEIGGFDPALGTGSPALAGADIESFTHAIIQGSRLAYEPRALCWHNHRADEAGLRRQTFTYAVGATAILTKWLLRDPRLLWCMLRQSAGLLGGALNPPDSAAAPSGMSRFALQLRMNRSRGTITRQFGGYALGPFLYLRSLLWVKRRHLRGVVPPSRASHE